ncbi:MAG: sulfite exporter TauE/SafE family protein [Gemmataceae bacterium]|nr:sulfite exporter TauE/SafE family protein [Gemmataceae bacterium]MCI0738635.1 sulfite exporter TauE/SafE family protein [Gemmataceae bacterium]
MTNELLEFARLCPLGIAIGAYGTLVGAGGGSLLIPALLLIMPNESPATLTSMSLAVVFFNAYSGTLAYMRMGRIDYRAGVLFSLAGIPGTVVGVLLVHHIAREFFDPLFGVLLLGMGVFLVSNPLGSVSPDGSGSNGDAPNACLGAIGSAYIAVVSSLLGIGGGIIHVPFLIRVLRMPPHTATATSHFVLTFMALTATSTHIVLGEFEHGINQTMYLAIGVMMGAPLGAALSAKLRGNLIVRLLAVALCLVGLRLIGRLMLS